MNVFNDAEVDFLTEVGALARLATVGRDGMPHVTPVGWSLSDDHRSIEVGGIELARTKKFRDIQHSGRAALVIDDVQPSWRPRGIEVRGRADALTVPKETIRIHPERIIAWGFDGAGGARDVPRTSGGDVAAGQAATSPMQAVVRHNVYDPEALAARPDVIDEFDRVHAAQDGYAGSAVIDVGDGERIMVTLWDSEMHAAAARSELGPVVQRLLRPLEREPSRLLGTGPVISTDLRLAPRIESR